MNNLFKSILLVGVASFSANGQTPGSWLERAELDVARGDYQAANSEAEAVRNQLNSKTSDPRQIRPVVLRIAEIKSLAGKYSEANEIVGKIQATFKPLTPLESVRTQIVLAVSQAETGNLTGAQVAAQGAVEAAKESGVDDVWTANARAELAHVLLQEGRLFEAREMAVLVQTAARQNLNSPSLSANALSVYVEVALADGRVDDARTWVETVRRARSREATHPDSMMLREIEARVGIAEGKPAQSLELIDSVIALAKPALEASHRFVARCFLTRAEAEIRARNWPEARDALAAAGALVDVPYTPVDLRLEWQMSSVEAMTQRLKEAQQHFAEVKATFGANHPEYRRAASELAEAQRQFDDQYAGAFKVYRQAADQGSATATTNIGLLYEHGYGVAQDYGQAMQWYRKAADTGNAFAMVQIGGLYEKGLGIPKDRSEAISWYRKAAALGNGLAKDSLKGLGDIAGANPDAGDRLGGTTRTNPKDGLAYVWIPPGRFVMGCSPGDNECDDREKPAHAVTITKGFWMGQTAVTVGAWKRYVKSMDQAMPPEPKILDREFNARWQNEQQPIVNITWAEAQSYCEVAGMRLPTEAEWEYAARAGTTEPRYGDLDGLAWYADNGGTQRIDSAEISKKDLNNYFRRLLENGNGPHPVGMKQPNAWRLYDMLGNVWQWTSDWFDEKYYGQQEWRDPQGPPGAPHGFRQQRTMRGGSWESKRGTVRVSFRGGSDPGFRYVYFGARCVWETFP
jgi:formylglycine-generating enzyme